MTDDLIRYYQAQKEHILNTCTACGKCVQVCPIIEKTELKDIAGYNIQKALLEYLAGGEMNDTVYTRIYSCMSCFRCSVDTCPARLDPLLMIEIAKWEAKQRLDKAADDNNENDIQPEKVLASIQVPATDMARLFHEPEKRKAQTVFFPGCHIYNQPEKVLSALDVMHAIGEDWVYLPGVDNCCGDMSLFLGDVEKAQGLSDNLIKKLEAFEPQTVVLWCPTCKCRFDEVYQKIYSLPYKILSFPQYIAEHFEQLTVQGALFPSQVTLHEACKAAYTGSDMNGVRDLIEKLPGYELVEMPRHGKDAACCGSGAVVYYKDAFHHARDTRLTEAQETGACAMVDVCHYCHQTFAGADPQIDVVNYISLLAESMGIDRPDKLKQYLAWGDVGLIMADAAPYLKTSPYSEETIRRVVEKLIEESVL